MTLHVPAKESIEIIIVNRQSKSSISKTNTPVELP